VPPTSESAAGTGPGHPDYRFTLANERTLLAWLRTGLALVAGGVAVASYVPALGVSWGGGAVGLALVATGLGTALAGYRRWRRNERATAADAPLSGGPEVPALVTLVAAVVLLVAVLVVAEVAGR
jgi:putative membrane protein